MDDSQIYRISSVSLYQYDKSCVESCHFFEKFSIEESEVDCRRAIWRNFYSSLGVVGMSEIDCNFVSSVLSSLMA